jgi:hypothetical protein
MCQCMCLYVYARVCGPWYLSLCVCLCMPMLLGNADGYSR